MWSSCRYDYMAAYDGNRKDNVHCDNNDILFKLVRFFMCSRR
jgi:hypothetical protein